MKRTDKEIEQQVIDLYSTTNLSMTKVGQQFGLSGATVMAILNRNNIPKRTKGGIYKIPDNDVIQKYTQENKSCQKIANEYNVSFSTISMILEKYNIKRDNTYFNKKLQNDYFSKIDTYDKAYFLGFLITDGNITKEGNAVRLSLKLEDEEILKVFTSKIKSENQLVYRQDKPEVTFSVKNKQWKMDLAKFGVIPCKTASVEMPLLTDDMMPHLIRGMIDGDGSISSKSHYIFFCGNEKIVQQLHDFLVKKLNLYNVKILHTEENLWSCQWSSKKDILKIGQYIYQNKQDCYLKRKYNNFLQIIQDDTEVTSLIAKGKEAPQSVESE